MLDKLTLEREKFAVSAKGYKSSNAYIALTKELEDGRIFFKDLGGGPCHGALQNYYSDRRPFYDDAKDVFILSYVQNLRVEKGQADQFFDYLVNRSPFANIFIEKNLDNIYKLGHVVSTQHPENLVISGLIASRFVTENYNDVIVERVKIFFEIKRLGFDENFAFIMAHLFNGCIQPKRYKVTYSPISSGHSVFDFNGVSEAYIRNFVNATPTNPHKNTFFTSRGYGLGVTSLWAKSVSGEAFANWMRGLKPLSNKEAKNLNIFYKPKITNFEITSEEDFKDILEQIKERINL